MVKQLSCVTIAAAGCLALFMVAGCLSDHPGSSSLAYVDIESQGADAVRPAVIRVFEDDGYALTQSGEGLVFEREATQRDKVLYGHYGDDRLVMRVVVTIEARRLGGCLVRADAFALRDGNAEPLPRMARRPFQGQLNRVKAGMVTSGAGGVKTR